MAKLRLELIEAGNEMNRMREHHAKGGGPSRGSNKGRQEAGGDAPLVMEDPRDLKVVDRRREASHETAKALKAATQRANAADEYAKGLHEKLQAADANVRDRSDQTRAIKPYSRMLISSQSAAPGWPIRHTMRSQCDLSTMPSLPLCPPPTSLSLSCHSCPRPALSHPAVHLPWQVRMLKQQLLAKSSEHTARLRQQLAQDESNEPSGVAGGAGVKAMPGRRYASSTAKLPKLHAGAPPDPASWPRNKKPPMDLRTLEEGFTTAFPSVGIKSRSGLMARPRRDPIDD